MSGGAVSLHFLALFSSTLLSVASRLSPGGEKGDCPSSRLTSHLLRNPRERLSSPSRSRGCCISLACLSSHNLGAQEMTGPQTCLSLTSEIRSPTTGTESRGGMDSGRTGLVLPMSVPEKEASRRPLVPGAGGRGGLQEARERHCKTPSNSCCAGPTPLGPSGLGLRPLSLPGLFRPSLFVSRLRLLQPRALYLSILPGTGLAVYGLLPSTKWTAPPGQRMCWSK